MAVLGTILLYVALLAFFSLCIVTALYPDRVLRFIAVRSRHAETLIGKKYWDYYLGRNPEIPPEIKVSQEATRAIAILGALFILLMLAFITMALTSPYCGPGVEVPCRLSGLAPGGGWTGELA